MSKVAEARSPLLDQPPLRALLRLSAPNIAGAVIMSGSYVVEGWFLGRLPGAELAGAALVFPLLMLMQMLSAGAVGGAVAGAAARARGAGDIERVETVLRVAIATSFVFSALIAGLMWFFGEEVFRMLGGEGEILAAALAYANVLFPGVLTIWLFNMQSSVLRGTGDMLTPALGLSLVFVTHFIASGFLVGGWGGAASQGIAGAAAAVILAFATGAVAMGVFLRRPGAMIRLRLGATPLAVAVPLLRSGLLAGSQSVLTIVYALLVASQMGFYGEHALAGYGIGARLELLMVPVVFGVGGALIALTGAYVGAGRRDEAIRIAWKGAGLIALLVGAAGVLLTVLSQAWLPYFTALPETLGFADAYLWTVGPCYGFFALGLCLYFASQGLNTLLLPVSGAVLRLAIVATGALLVAEWRQLYHVVALAMIAYGIFNAGTLALGPWRKGRIA